MPQLFNVDKPAALALNRDTEAWAALSVDELLSGTQLVVQVCAVHNNPTFERPIAPMLLAWIAGHPNHTDADGEPLIAHGIAVASAQPFTFLDKQGEHLLFTRLHMELMSSEGGEVFFMRSDNPDEGFMDGMAMQQIDQTAVPYTTLFGPAWGALRAGVEASTIEVVGHERVSRSFHQLSLAAGELLARLSAAEDAHNHDGPLDLTRMLFDPTWRVIAPEWTHLHNADLALAQLAKDPYRRCERSVWQEAANSSATALAYNVLACLNPAFLDTRYNRIASLISDSLGRMPVSGEAAPPAPVLDESIEQFLTDLLDRTNFR